MTTLLPMYPAAVNSPDTTLAVAIDAVETTITVLDASVIPLGGDETQGLMIIRADDFDSTPETILVNPPVGNTFIDCVRGFQGTAKPFLAGAKVCRMLTDYDSDAWTENILRLNALDVPFYNQEFNGDLDTLITMGVWGIGTITTTHSPEPGMPGVMVVATYSGDSTSAQFWFGNTGLRFYRTAPAGMFYVWSAWIPLSTGLGALAPPEVGTGAAGDSTLAARSNHTHDIDAESHTHYLQYLEGADLNDCDVLGEGVFRTDDDCTNAPYAGAAGLLIQSGWSGLAAYCQIFIPQTDSGMYIRYATWNLVSYDWTAWLQLPSGLSATEPPAIGTGTVGDSSLAARANHTHDPDASQAEFNLMCSDSMSTGLIWGGALTINGGDSTLFDIAAGGAIVLDNTTDGEHPVQTLVRWTARIEQVDPYLATADTVYIGIDATGTLHFKADAWFTPAERRTIAAIGWLDHVNRTEIEFTSREPFDIVAAGSAIQDFFTAFGSFNISGNTFFALSGLQIQRSIGSAFTPNQNYENNRLTPHTIETGIESPALIWYFYRDVGDAWVNDTPQQGVIDPEHWDNGSGTLADVDTGYWTIQAISYYPLWLANDIQYGQVQYPTFEEAHSALQDPILINPYNEVDVFRGWIIVQQGCLDLTDEDTAVFVPAGKLGMMDVGSGGGTGGETNTASNCGLAGTGLYHDKSGVDLRFKNINPASSLVTITDNPTNHTVDIGIDSETTLTDSDAKIPTSGAVVDALAGKANSSHGHAESDITNLTTDLGNKSDVGHIHEEYIALSIALGG